MADAVPRAPSAPAAGPVPAIDAARLWDRLVQLGRIGATGRGGVDRQALTDGEIAAWRQVIAWSAEHGMRAATDDAGNLFLTLPGADPALPPVLTGSHLDTQPTGGLFDGAFGVLAGIEAAAALADGGRTPRRSLVVVAWMNEEGCRFAPGMMGSDLFAGRRSLAAVRAARDGSGVSVGTELDRLHAAFPSLPRLPLGFPFRAYVEAHIEQGPVLEAAGCAIGIVTGIQGKKTYRVTLHGQEAHAGTAGMAGRRDAVAALGRVLSALHEGVGRADLEVKFTVGRILVEPNAPSVVPARAVFSIDLRHPDNTCLARLGAEVEAVCAAQAPPCSVEVEALVDAASVAFDPAIQEAVAAAAARRGHAAMRLLSAAGHDARQMAGLGPSGMVFIPCRDGVSHAEHEWAEPAHVAAGAEVLLGTLLPLLDEGED